MTARTRLDAPHAGAPAAFGAALADIGEHAPRVAAHVTPQRPSPRLDALHGAMVDAVARLDEPARVAFHAVHPEPAGADARRSPPIPSEMEPPP